MQVNKLRFFFFHQDLLRKEKIQKILVFRIRILVNKMHCIIFLHLFFFLNRFEISKELEIDICATKKLMYLYLYI